MNNRPFVILFKHINESLVMVIIDYFSEISYIFPFLPKLVHVL
jgi:hypothetical protein